MVRHIARTAEVTNSPANLAGRPERKRKLGRHRRRWKDNIKVI